MKRFARILTLCLLLVFLFYNVGFSQLSKRNDGLYTTELTVKFKTKAFETVDDKGLTSLKSLTPENKSLEKIFLKYGNITFTKVFKNTNWGDTIKYNFRGEKVRVPDLSQFYRISFPTSVKLWETLYSLKMFSEIESVSPPVTIIKQLSPSDYNSTYQWYLDKINATGAWNISTGSNTISVAVIDDGVNASHPDLSSKLIGGESGYSNGLNNHGTLVAGVVGAATNNGTTGIASLGWNIMIRPYNDNTGNSFPEDIRNASDNGSRIINCSFGLVAPDPNDDAKYVFCNDDSYSMAIQYAVNLGTVIVASAGNPPGDITFSDGKTRQPNQYPPYTIYPAAYPGVIAVSATNSLDQFPSGYNYGSFIDVSAPGINIKTTEPGLGYGYHDGTSFSSPLVAALAGLLLSKNPSLTNAQVANTICYSAEDLGASGKDDYFGYGRINADKALRNLYVPQVYSTIQAALDVATSGQRVVLSSGTYSISSSVTIPDGITLLIYSGASLTFSAGAQLTVYGTLQVDGATFSCPAGTTWSGIKLIGASSASYIRNSQINNFGPGYGSDGIYIEDCSPLIEYNTISGTYNGIKVYGASPTISHNTIQFCSAGNGITVENGSSAQINANNINHNYFHGISVYGNSGNVTIYENTLNNNGYITRTYTGLRAYGSNNISAWKNTITNSNFGVYSESNSSINFGFDYGPFAFTPNNNIHDCSYGLVAYNNSLINAGQATTGGYAACHNYVTTITNYALQASNNSSIYARDNYYGSNDMNPIIYKDSGSNIETSPLWNGSSTFSKVSNFSFTSQNDEEGVLNQSYLYMSNCDYTKAKSILKEIINKGSIKALNPLLKLYFASRDKEIRAYLENITSNPVDTKNANYYKQALMKLYYGIGEYKSTLSIADELITKGNAEAKIDKFLVYALGLRDNSLALSIISEINKDLGKERADELYTLLLPERNNTVPNQQNKFVYHSDIDQSKPYEYSLSQNYPNPFNPATVINYQIPQAGLVSLKVFDMLGKEITTLERGYKNEGKYSVDFNGSNLPSGIYIYKLEVKGADNSLFIANKKMVLIK